MQSPWKKLLIVLYLNSFFLLETHANQSPKVELLILDKSSSTKYSLAFDQNTRFRDLSIELISCQKTNFDKYTDTIALLKILQKDRTYIGWFFKITDELNLYSNKIYEVSLIECVN